MPHCTKCGATIEAGTTFCGSCGQPQGTAAPATGGAASAQQSGLTENTAAVLSYVVGWITGIIFFAIDKRPYVRFHAAQSIVTFGALHLILIILGSVFGLGMFWGGGWGAFGFGFILYQLISLACLILWILCMVKAGQGQRFEVPVTGQIAKNIFKT